MLVGELEMLVEPDEVVDERRNAQHEYRLNDISLVEGNYHDRRYRIDEKLVAEVVLHDHSSLLHLLSFLEGTEIDRVIIMKFDERARI